MITKEKQQTKSTNSKSSTSKQSIQRDKQHLSSPNIRDNIQNITDKLHDR